MISSHRMHKNAAVMAVSLHMIPKVIKRHTASDHKNVLGLEVALSNLREKQKRAPMRKNVML